MRRHQTTGERGREVGNHRRPPLIPRVGPGRVESGWAGAAWGWLGWVGCLVSCLPACVTSERCTARAQHDTENVVPRAREREERQQQRSAQVKATQENTHKVWLATGCVGASPDMRRGLGLIRGPGCCAGSLDGMMRRRRRAGEQSRTGGVAKYVRVPRTSTWPSYAGTGPSPRQRQGGIRRPAGSRATHAGKAVGRSAGQVAGGGGGGGAGGARWLAACVLAI
jgi:hypothetical protein